jgi:hypothetical protein
MGSNIASWKKRGEGLKGGYTYGEMPPSRPRLNLRTLTIDQPLRSFRISGTLHVNLRSSFVDFSQII